MLKQPNFFYSQPSTLPKDAPAKLFLSMSFCLSFMISSVASKFLSRSAFYTSKVRTAPAKFHLSATFRLLSFMVSSVAPTRSSTSHAYSCNHQNPIVDFLCIFNHQNRKTPGGELPYEEYTGVCHELGSYFQEKIPKRVCQFFTKIQERAIISVRNSR